MVRVPESTFRKAVAHHLHARDPLRRISENIIRYGWLLCEFEPNASIIYHRRSTSFPYNSPTVSKGYLSPRRYEA